MNTAVSRDTHGGSVLLSISRYGGDMRRHEQRYEEIWGRSGGDRASSSAHKPRQGVDRRRVDVDVHTDVSEEVEQAARQLRVEGDALQGDAVERHAAWRHKRGQDVSRGAARQWAVRAHGGVGCVAGDVGEEVAGERAAL